MFNNCLKATALGLLMFVPVFTAFAESDSHPETTVDGLIRVPDSKLAIVYADPGADLSAYDSVMILEAYVAFKKNWARDQRRSAGSLSAAPRPDDIEKMKAIVAKEFNEVFSKVLSDGGYQVTDDEARQ